MKKISVIGFGKIGQAVAANILTHKISVVAVDINPELEGLFKNHSFSSNEPELDRILVESFKEGQLTITTDFCAIQDTAAVLVCIPLLVDRSRTILQEPFLNCFEALAPFLAHGMLLVIETSIPVGFSRNHVLPLLESSGKKHDQDFYLIHSPERIKSGSMLQQLQTRPKIIGGINDAAANKGLEIYRGFFDQALLRKVSNIETVEFIKLAGMAYRDINIAIANQLAQLSSKMDIDFTEVVEHTNTSGETHLLLPGIGVGGHCTPVYPYFLIGNFKQVGLDFSLAQESRRVNDSMAEYAVELIDCTVEVKKALILGLGFRPEIKEDTFSTTFLLHDRLKEKDFQVFVNDPYFSEEEIHSKHLVPADDIYSTHAEAIFLVTHHKVYEDIDWAKLKASGGKIFVDGRNAINKQGVEAAGIQYLGIGR